jgi:hypothetical protein
MKRSALVLLSLVSGLWLGAVIALPARASPLQAERIFSVVGDFTGKKDNVATDLSGIACVTAAEPGSRRCLVIDDEGRVAQFADISNATITPRNVVKLFGKSPPPGTFGSEPQENGCGGNDDFKDLDGEGVAVNSAGAFYVVGSHGCSRKSDLFRGSSFLLLKVEGDGASPTVSGTFRVSEALMRAPTVGTFFTKKLAGSEQGANIEGVASVGGELIFGMRAPVLDDTAILVEVPEDALFSAAPLPEGAVKEVPVFLGPHTGIRDLAPLPDGSLLVLAGPSQDENVPYRIFQVDPTQGMGRQLAILADVNESGQRLKAEGLAVLDIDESEIRVVVLFDGAPDGGAREYRLPRPR